MSYAKPKSWWGDIRDFGGTGDGTDGAADTFAFQSFVNTAKPNDVLYLPDLTHEPNAGIVLVDTIHFKQNNLTNMAGVQILGVGDTSSAGRRKTNIYWAKPKRRFTSVTASAPLVGDDANFVTLGGLSGMSAANIGERVMVRGAAQYQLNAQYIIVGAPSSTTIVVSCTDGVTVQDGNTGALIVTFLDSMFDVRAQQMGFKNFNALCVSAGSFIWSVFNFTESEETSAQPNTHLLIENVYCSTLGVGVSSQFYHAIEVGTPYLPRSGHTRYAGLDHGYLKVMMPYNCDYVQQTNLVLDRTDGARLYTENSTDQSRAHTSITCTNVGTNYGVLGGAYGSVLPHEVGYDVGSLPVNRGSLSFSEYDCGYGGITKCVWWLQQGNVPINIYNVQLESAAMLLNMTMGGISTNHFHVHGGYLNFANGIQASGLIAFAQNGPVTFRGCNFFAETGSLMQVQITGTSGIMRIQDCDFPAEAWSGVPFYDFAPSIIAGKILVSGNTVIDYTGPTVAIEPTAEFDSP